MACVPSNSAFSLDSESAWAFTQSVLHYYPGGGFFLRAQLASQCQFRWSWWRRTGLSHWTVKWRYVVLWSVSGPEASLSLFYLLPHFWEEYFLFMHVCYLFLFVLYGRPEMVTSCQTSNLENRGASWPVRFVWTCQGYKTPSSGSGAFLAPSPNKACRRYFNLFCKHPKNIKLARRFMGEEEQCWLSLFKFNSASLRVSILTQPWSNHIDQEKRKKKKLNATQARENPHI